MRSLLIMMQERQRSLGLGFTLVRKATSPLLHATVHLSYSTFETLDRLCTALQIHYADANPDISPFPIARRTNLE
jgi:hypothetical protein